MAAKQKAAAPDRKKSEDSLPSAITEPSRRTVPVPSEESLEGINKRNRDFWNDLAQTIDPLLKNPGIVLDALNDLHEAIDSYGIAHAVEAKGKAHELVGTLESRLLQAAARNSARQSRISKGKPKNRTEGPREVARAVVTQAMRTPRREGKTLGEFIDSAGKDGFDSIDIFRKEGNPSRYVIQCNGMDEEEKFGESTINRWWKDAETAPSA